MTYVSNALFVFVIFIAVYHIYELLIETKKKTREKDWRTPLARLSLAQYYIWVELKILRLCLFSLPIQFFTVNTLIYLVDLQANILQSVCQNCGIHGKVSSYYLIALADNRPSISGWRPLPNASERSRPSASDSYQTILEDFSTREIFYGV